MLIRDSQVADRNLSHKQSKVFYFSIYTHWRGASSKENKTAEAETRNDKTQVKS